MKIKRSLWQFWLCPLLISSCPREFIRTAGDVIPMFLYMNKFNPSLQGSPQFGSAMLLLVALCSSICFLLLSTSLSNDFSPWQFLPVATNVPVYSFSRTCSTRSIVPLRNSITSWLAHLSQGSGSQLRGAPPAGEGWIWALCMFSSKLLSFNNSNSLLFPETKQVC